MNISVRDTFDEASRYEGWISAFPRVRFILASMNMAAPGDDPGFRRKFLHDNAAGLLGLEKGE